MESLPLPRRDFLTRSAALSALAVLAGACGDLGALTGPSTLDKDIVVKLADYPALAQAGGVARISGVSLPIALVNLGAGSWAALSLSCPHQGTTVQANGSGFLCPNHGARFAADGAWTGGQRTSSLRRYPTTYDAQAGTVVVSPG